MGIALAIIDVDIDDFTVSIIDRQEYGVDETLVGREVQPLVALQHFCMEYGIDLHGITLHELAGRLVVTLALDALDLCQQTGDELAQLYSIAGRSS